MPEGRTPAEAAFFDDLREHLAAIGGAPMPPGVLAMTASTLERRRGRTMRWLAPAGVLVSAGAVAAAALLALHQAGSVTDKQAAFGNPAGAGSAAGSGAGGMGVAYPGVDPAVLEGVGHTRLLSPAGRGTATVTPDAARAAAAAALAGRTAPGAPPGEPVLAWVDDRSAAPVACFCWVVGIPAGTNQTAASGHLLLVYIDAVTGVVAGSHTGAGT